MATPNIVPRVDQEGGLGTAAKGWGKLFIENAAAGGTAAAPTPACPPEEEIRVQPHQVHAGLGTRRDTICG